MGGDGFKMPRFFVKTEAIQSGFINITGDDVNHIRKVLRLRPGDNITVCDGEGNDYYVKIEEVEAEQVSASIISMEKSRNEPPVRITLFQGLPKSDKMDLIVQKSIELGISRIVPVITDHTVVRIENRKDAENKAIRWRRIALEAAKQCNRARIPQVEMPVSYTIALEELKKIELAFIPYERETKNSLRKYLSGVEVRDAAIMIGPEGGFSEKEIELAVSYGVMPVTLGPRILRTETAGMAALSILMYELGDMGR